MHSGGAIPIDAIELVAGTIWCGTIWKVKTIADETFVSYWNTQIEAEKHHSNMMRDKPKARTCDPVQVPALFIYTSEQVRIVPMLEIGI